MKYVCPMHPEIQSDKPGRCDICGMKLVSPYQDSKNSYTPLVIVVGMILLITLVITYRDVQLGHFNIRSTISYFMTGFFLTFSAFKLMDLKGFAEGYSQYDLLAKQFYEYGYIYPFIELFFGISMILKPENKTLLWSEFFVMTFSGIGVLIKVLKREKFQCSCLGTFLKVPLTYVTLIEDFGMALFALILLVIH